VAERVTDWVDSPARGEVPSRRRSKGDEGSGVRPPRWSFPLCGTRLRISVGMGAWLVAAAGALAWSPATPVAWLPLLVVLSVAVSTLVHEGAHAWAAHNLGYRVEWVVLGGLAGVTAYFGRDDRPLERAAVALAGPAASAALVLALVAVRTALTPASTITALVEIAIGLNVLALVANLLPVGGTDGAHLVRSLFQHHRQSRTPGRG
jgi:Zn-dependent protease